jgi:hypothetical protein
MVTLVVAICAPNVAVTLAVPPALPVGVITPVDATMLPICPRSIAKDAWTVSPFSVAVKGTVGDWVP